jgi:hypothetical protein
MLEQPMIEKLLGMRLQGIAVALKTQEQDPGVRELSFIERLSLLVDSQEGAFDMRLRKRGWWQKSESKRCCHGRRACQLTGVCGNPGGKSCDHP